MSVTGTPVTTGDHYGTSGALVSLYGSKGVARASNTSTESDAINDARVDEALAWSDRFIDEFLGGVGFTTPLTSPPAGIADIAVQLAYVYLMTPSAYRVDSSNDAGPGRELFFAKRDAKQRLQYIAVFGMGTAALTSVTDARPTWA